MTKRVVNKLINAVFIVAMAALIAAGTAGVLLHVRVVSVLTGSMKPHYAPGSMVITSETATSDLRVGDVIAFRPPANFDTPTGQPIMHRITGITTTNGTIQVRTRGDANPAADPWVLDLTQVKTQRAVAVVPLAGNLITALQNSNHTIAQTSIAGVLLMIGAFVLYPRHRKEYDCKCDECFNVVLATETIGAETDRLEAQVATDRPISIVARDQRAGTLDWIANFAQHDLEADWVLFSSSTSDSLQYVVLDMGTGGEVYQHGMDRDDYASTLCWQIGITGRPVVHEQITTVPPATAMLWKELGISSYMGVPVISSTGVLLGALCVADAKDRRWEAVELDALIEFARLGARHIESLDPSRLSAEFELPATITTSA